MQNFGSPQVSLLIVLLASLDLQLHVHQEAELGTVLEDGLPLRVVFPHLVGQLGASILDMEAHGVGDVDVFDGQLPLGARGHFGPGQEPDAASEPLVFRPRVVGPFLDREDSVDGRYASKGKAAVAGELVARGSALSLAPMALSM